MLGGRKFRTEEARKRENKRSTLILAGGIVGVCVLFVLTLYIIQLDALRIRHVYIDSDGALTNDELLSSVTATLESTHAFVIPNNSWLFTPHALIAENLQKAFPRINTVRVQRTNSTDITISVEERRPDALWCGDVVPTLVRESIETQEHAADEAWGTCYLMDRNAYIYARAPLYTGNIYTRYYGSLDHAEPIGQPLVPVEEFLAWQSLAETMHEGEHVPVAILFTDEHDVEVYLRGGVRVLLPRNELERAYTRLMSLYESEALKETEDIEYIDLRFGTKAFIKYWSDEGMVVDDSRKPGV
jgi:cell division septal protein FtsQ